MNRIAALVILLPLSSVFLCAHVTAYDTGHHNDLTRNTLQLKGYNSYAQEIAGLANFFVDYYAFTPDLDPEHLPELMMMHFDNVFTLQNASFYWTQFTINAKKAVEQAASSNDPLRYIMTIGGTLHTVQDFYTHSNWVDLHQGKCDCFRNETWFQSLHAANGNLLDLPSSFLTLKTYSYGECDEYSRNCYPGQVGHGDYCGGVNKDSYNRPFFEQSYSFAFAGSIEWVENIHIWANAVNPDIIASAQNYVPPTQEDLDDLSSLIKQIRSVSYAIKIHGEEDGHWKGAGSGSLKRFADSVTEFTTSNSIYKDKYLKDKIHQAWTFPNIYDAPDAIAGGMTYSPAVTITQPLDSVSSNSVRAVRVRTARVSGPDHANTPSYYARVTIDGLTMVEVTQIDEASLKPFWTSIKFVNTSLTTIPITYQLVNDKFPGTDDVVPITAEDGDLQVTFDVSAQSLSGNNITTGVYNSPNAALSVSSPSSGVTLSVYVNSKQVGNCILGGLPQSFCPDHAYEELGVHPWCFTTDEDTVSVGTINICSTQFVIGSVLMAFSIFVIVVYLL